MADQSDVETALATLASARLYPDGTTNASITGAMLRVYRGWPGNSALESDLAAGIDHVSVNAVPGAQEQTAQFPRIWEIPEPVVPALTVSSGGGVVTFAGSAAPGQLAGLLVDDAAFAYRTLPGDTPASVAASLAALVGDVRAVTVTGASVAVLGTARLIGRVVADQAAVMQLRRQQGRFRLTCWCADPALRDATAAAIDAGFAQTAFVALPDGSAGRLLAVRSDAVDDLATLPLYRRDLTYSVEYPTTIAQTQPSMLFGLFGVLDATAIDTLRIS